MNCKNVFFGIILLCAARISGQNSKLIDKTEILTYVSATYDPASTEKQIEFKSSDNEKRIFYYSGQDSLKPEEQFFKQPSAPITTEGLNLTKEELIGKHFKITYHALTESVSTQCCFIMKLCEAVK